MNIKEDTETLFKAAQQAMLGKDWEAAEALWRQLLQANIDSPQGFAGLCKCILKNGGDQAQAEQTIREGARRFPDDKLIRRQLGALELMKGNCQAALDCWDYAPQDPRAYPPNTLLQMTTALHKLARHDEAIALLEEGLQKWPDHQQLRQRLKRLRAARPGASTHDCIVIADEPLKYRITHFRRKAGSRKVFVTFGIVGSNLDDPPFGSPFLTDQGYDHVHVAQAPMSQYQELSLEDFARLVGPLVAGKEAFTYGSSLGGYCAIYYGGVINARIISASPRNSAHPLLRKNHFPELVYKHAEIAQVPRSSKAPFIFVDRHIGADAKFYDHCIRPVYPDAHEIVLPHAGHGAFNLLMEAKLLKQLVIDIANDEFSPERLDLDFSGLSIYHQCKASYLLRQKELDAAIENARLSIERLPSFRAYKVLIRALKLKKKRGRAREAYAEALARLPKAQQQKLAGLAML